MHFKAPERDLSECYINVGVEMFNYWIHLRLDWTVITRLCQELSAKTHRMRRRNFRKLILFLEVWSVTSQFVKTVLAVIN